MAAGGAGGGVLFLPLYTVLIMYSLTLSQWQLEELELELVLKLYTVPKNVLYDP
jgi:hypothetical protein